MTEVIDAQPERSVSDTDRSLKATGPSAEQTGRSVSDTDRSLLERIGRRVVRRPTEWAARPWPTSRIVQYVVTVATLATTTVIMANVVHLSFVPSRDLIFDDTTPTGGDFGAHVWGPAYLRDHLLPSGWFNGWSMDWYAGLPTYRFYMVLPALMILFANLFLQYGVAMKLVSVLGVVTLPVSSWAFGRLARFRYPIPELMAFGGLAFALEESFSIYGGNVKSTMAGEFSFSIALSIAVLALGVLARGLETGRFRVWAAVLIAAAGVSHGIVLIYVAVAAVVLCLLWVDRRRVWYAVTVGITAVLLMMWWVGPFLSNHAYMTDMKYEPKPDWADSYWSMFFPHDTVPVLDFLITALAVLGFVMCVVRGQRNGAALGVTAIVFVALVYATSGGGLPVIGLLWNPRLLPFIYLLRFLLMTIGAFELFSLVKNAASDTRARANPGWGWATGFFAVISLAVLLVEGWVYQELPGGRLEVKREGKPAVYAWGPFSAGQLDDDPTGDALADGWASYNFHGYEGRQQYYTEYHGVVTLMQRLGAGDASALDPESTVAAGRLGCGRALWENHEDNGQYGTTMALMLLPFWTDGCIGSMEGLFFEASGTTPYHFLTTAAMSEKSSNPVRELRYTDRDAAVGVRYMRDLGVHYAMVRTDGSKRRAAAEDGLAYLASSGPWDVYLVDSSSVVEPLAVQPVVVNRRGGDQRERNLELGTSWFQNPSEWAAMPADGGPAEWQRIDVVVDESRHSVNASGEQNRVDVVTPYGTIDPVELAPVTVTDVDLQQQSLAFDVDRVGVPVLVKVSYFPNWKANGAEGPWRIGANMMVVVPTSTHVELTFEQNLTDYATAGLTGVGLLLCVFWRFRGDVKLGGATGDAPAGAGPDPDDQSGPWSEREDATTGLDEFVGWEADDADPWLEPLDEPIAEPVPEDEPQSERPPWGPPG